MRKGLLFSICFFLFITTILHLNTNAQTKKDSVSILYQTQRNLQNNVTSYYRSTLSFGMGITPINDWVGWAPICNFSYQVGKSEKSKFNILFNYSGWNIKQIETDFSGGDNLFYDTDTLLSCSSKNRYSYWISGLGYNRRLFQLNKFSAYLGINVMIGSEKLYTTWDVKLVDNGDTIEENNYQHIQYNGFNKDDYYLYFVGLRPTISLDYKLRPNLSIGIQSGINLGLGIGNTYLGFGAPQLKIMPIINLQYSFEDVAERKKIETKIKQPHRFNDAYQEKSERIENQFAKDLAPKNSIAISALPAFSDYNNHFLVSPKFNLLYKRELKNNLSFRLGGEVNWYSTYKTIDNSYSVTIDSTLYEGLKESSYYLNYSINMGLEKKLFAKSGFSLAYGCDLVLGHKDYSSSEISWNEDSYTDFYYLTGNLDYYYYAGLQPFVSGTLKLSNRFDLSLQTGLTFLLGVGTRIDNSNTVAFSGNFTSYSMTYKRIESPANTTGLFVSYRF